jgi:peptide/nickel transport system substrate-binding protein
MRHGRLGFITLLYLAVAGCSRQGGPATVDKSDSALKIGYGLTAGARLELAAQLMTQEGLVNLNANGRPVPWLATSWSYSDDGLALRLNLQPQASFHDGTPASASVLREALLQQLPAALGPVYDDIAEIRAVSSTELLFVLKRRSTLLLEGLTGLLHAPNSTAGTGPFYNAGRRGNSIDLVAYEKYYEGRSAIDRIAIEPYTSVRAAWADMLRGELDMVYELGLDALDLTRTASGTKVFTFQRPYSYVVILNVNRPSLRDVGLRRALNDSINRDELVSRILDGHARPADGPIWPQHWVEPARLSHFAFKPKAPTTAKTTFTCLYSDPSFERIALFIQQQLQAIGVDVRIELTSIDDGLARVDEGNFDAWLADVGLGPSFFRQYLFWHTGSPYNWGHYSNAKVDAALDAIKAARSEDEYKAGAAAFQDSIIEDPPAIFLGWSERARAVSTRFDVHSEPGRDILSTLRLWRPVAAPNSTLN